MKKILEKTIILALFIWLSVQIICIPLVGLAFLICAGAFVIVIQLLLLVFIYEFCFKTKHLKIHSNAFGFG